MGIVRLPLRIDGIHARIRQIDTRYLQEGAEVGQVLDDIIEATTTSFHFTLTASLTLLSSCKLIHHSLCFGVEYVALRFIVVQVCPRLFERSIQQAPTSSSGIDNADPDHTCSIDPAKLSIFGHSLSLA